MSYEYEYAVFIGRFQPFHNGHLEIVEAALKKAKNLIVVIGSARSGRNIKNPWSYHERVSMITGSLPEYQGRLHFVGIRDYYYNDQLWLAELHQKVREITDGADVALVGQYSDDSSYYLKMFPQWDFIPCHTVNKMHATEIRAQYFQGTYDYSNVPMFVQSVMRTYASDIPAGDFSNLKDEYEFTDKYKRSWATAPFVPIFVTTDAVVVQSGHILLVKRKFNPGKGKWALPGGFIKPNERIIDCAVRELYEETKLLVPKEITKAHIVDEPHVFDYPNRSLRGRTITHAICIKFDDKHELPQCKGADDAEKAQWIPIGDIKLMEENFYEDHLSIIEYWLHRIK
jgi:bifunctional NMN adenylyltransferase/nudix hydrolase